MKQVYQAFDGSIFDAEEDCIDHEIALRSKGEMVINWLITGVNAEISTIDLSDPEEGESHVESVEMLKWLHQIKRNSSAKKFIELAGEAEYLAYRWNDDPKTLEAARLILDLNDPLDVDLLPFLQRAIRLLSKSYAHTRISKGIPSFPVIDNNKEWSKFSDEVYRLEDSDAEAASDHSCDSESQGLGWMKAFDSGEYCKSCRYWCMDDPATVQDLRLISGICKRNPPVDGEFPSTKPWDSCGEWDE
jgi:hypothetical protein